MTTPGSGDQPQNPGQDPGQNPGQGWGQQQPPSGSSGPNQTGQAPQGGQQWAAPGGQPQQPGQPGPQQYGQPGQQQYGQPGQPQFGQQQYGQPGQPQYGQPGPQGQPGQPWAGQQFSGEAPKKERPAWQKRLPLVIGAVVVALVVAAIRGGFGGGAPEVGDCVKADGSSYDVVDCDSDEAQYRIFGTDSDMSESAFTADQSGEICLEAATESGVTDGVSLWYGNTGDDGQVFCAETL